MGTERRKGSIRLEERLEKGDFGKTQGGHSWSSSKQEAWGQIDPCTCEAWTLIGADHRVQLTCSGYAVQWRHGSNGRGFVYKVGLEAKSQGTKDSQRTTSNSIGHRTASSIKSTTSFRDTIAKRSNQWLLPADFLPLQVSPPWTKSFRFMQQGG
jgi:hypothetical protein